MPFQISELVIRVSGDATDGMIAGQAADECKGGHTVPNTPTECRKGGTTCMHPVVTACRKGGATCPDTTNCRHGGSTCAPPGKSKADARDAEMDFVLQQIRDAVQAEREEAEELVTA